MATTTELLKDMELPKLPSTDPNGLSAKYDLHCHCGSIRYTMTISPPLYASQTTAEQPEQCEAVECFCSYCARNGVWAVHPLTKDVVFTHGLHDRVEYLLGAKMNPQWFCRVCGSAVGTDLSPLTTLLGLEERYSINLRMLKDFDAEKLKVRKCDLARRLPPKYEDIIDEMYAKG
ncbi:hypothetical protein LTR36_004430 [Oleoguttula mirabilis]|uniref:CENP-V/GFA domain-containing protein n=1 Tax=Oleoguttula mirabilis TaxID=1507867 RepID=A0AAV9JGM1_9PEZI|nr:hypothetical protein LTR36_004430 [Oleoguttula mirabilis]